MDELIELLKQIDLIKVTPILISSVALLLSCLTYYATRLKEARIRLFPGEQIRFINGSNENGKCKLQIIVPCVVDNIGAKTGILHKSALLITDKIKHSDYLCEWAFFMKYVNEKDILENEDLAIPISLQGGQSTTKFIKFDGADACDNWTPNETSYEFKLLGWTKPQNDPDICYKFTLIFDGQDVSKICNLKQVTETTEIIVKRKELGEWKTRKLSANESNHINETTSHCRHC
jgi:hypothetical protein